MVRISSAVTAKRRKKRVLKLAKGQFSKRKSNFKQAKKSTIKGQQYAYRDRRRVKRSFRRLWIARLNAACREEGIMYSRFIKGLTAMKIGLNRKVLSELAIKSPEAFKKLVAMVKAG